MKISRIFMIRKPQICDAREDIKTTALCYFRFDYKKDGYI